MRKPYEFQILQHANAFRKTLDEVRLINILLIKDEYTMTDCARQMRVTHPKYNPNADDAVVLIFAGVKNVYCKCCGHKEAEFPAEIHCYINVSELIKYEKAYLNRRKSIEALFSDIKL
jgi:hypothetical protein